MCRTSPPAADFRHRFRGGKYELSGSVVVSRVAGSAQAIAATRHDAAHYYQRPDALRFDSTRTSLSGDVEALQVGKVAATTSCFRRITSAARGIREPPTTIPSLRRLGANSWNGTRLHAAR